MPLNPESGDGNTWEDPQVVTSALLYAPAVTMYGPACTLRKAGRTKFQQLVQVPCGTGPPKVLALGELSNLD